MAITYRVDPEFHLLETTCSGDVRYSVAADLERFESKVAWGACAIVAASDLLVGLSRIFQVFAERHFGAWSVVRTRAEAEDWLRTRREPSAR